MLQGVYDVMKRRVCALRQRLGTARSAASHSEKSRDMDAAISQARSDGGADSLGAAVRTLRLPGAWSVAEAVVLADADADVVDVAEADDEDMAAVFARREMSRVVVQGADGAAVVT